MTLKFRKLVLIGFFHLTQTESSEKEELHVMNVGAAVDMASFAFLTNG